MFGTVLPPVAKILQRGELRIANDRHVAAVAAVPAIWTAARDVFFMPKVNGTRAAVARPDFDLRYVDENHVYRLGRRILCSRALHCIRNVSNVVS
jgi:hypothetical protein